MPVVRTRELNLPLSMLPALIGGLTPMILNRLRVDPAVATGPFITTSIDIVSVFIYFRLALALLDAP